MSAAASDPWPLSDCVTAEAARLERQRAIDLAVRRLGARDRATFERCNVLATDWEHQASRVARDPEPSDLARQTTLRDCARALTDALAGTTEGTAS